MCRLIRLAMVMGLYWFCPGETPISAEEYVNDYTHVLPSYYLTPPVLYPSPAVMYPSPPLRFDGVPPAVRVFRPAYLFEPHDVLQPSNNYITPSGTAAWSRLLPVYVSPRLVQSRSLSIGSGNHGSPADPQNFAARDPRQHRD
ncbi:hypothetical protein GC163_03395 [bacterium]|nr:hypothetical protein [bacterium]